MEQIESVLARHRAELLDLPNVTAVGVTHRPSGDVIVVFVTHKVPPAQLRPEDAIPRAVEHYPIEVRSAIEVGEAGTRTGRTEGNAGRHE